MAKNLTRRPPGLFIGLATVDLTDPVEEIPGRNAKISVGSHHLRRRRSGDQRGSNVRFSGRPQRAGYGRGIASSRQPNTSRPEAKFGGLHDLGRRRKESPPVSSIMVLNCTGERTGGVGQCRGVLIAPGAAESALVAGRVLVVASGWSLHEAVHRRREAGTLCAEFLWCWIVGVERWHGRAPAVY